MYQRNRWVPIYHPRKHLLWHWGNQKCNYCSSWWVCVSQHYPSPSIILLCSLVSRIDAYAGTDQSAVQKQPEDSYPPTGVGRRRQSPPAEGDEERKRVLHYFRLLLPSSRRASKTGSGTIFCRFSLWTFIELAKYVTHIEMDWKWEWSALACCGAAGFQSSTLKQKDVIQFVPCCLYFGILLELSYFTLSQSLLSFSFESFPENVLCFSPTADVDGYDDGVLPFLLHYFGESDKRTACY